jgi:hypothetical protein
LVPCISLHSCARAGTSGLRCRLHRLMLFPPDARRSTNFQHVVQFLTRKSRLYALRTYNGYVSSHLVWGIINNKVTNLNPTVTTEWSSFDTDN